MDPILSAGQLGNVHLVVVDYPNDIELTSAAADANGNASIILDPVPQGFIWRVERQTTFVSDANGNLQLNTPAGALLNVYKVDGGQAVGRPIKWRDGSQSPGLDISDASSPLTVQQGLGLLYQWTGLTPGWMGNIAVQYQLVRRLVGVSG